MFVFKSFIYNINIENKTSFMKFDVRGYIYSPNKEIKNNCNTQIISLLREY